MKHRLQLAIVAAAFFALYAWLYVNRVQPLFAYANFSFSESVQQSYYWPSLLALIGVLWLLPNKDRPANIFAMVVCVFVLSSVLQVAIYYMDDGVRLPAVLAVLLGFAVIAVFAHMELNNTYSGTFWFSYIVGALVAICAALIIKEGLASGIHFVGFSDLYELRAELELSGAGRYALSLYVFSIGPMALAMALYHRHVIFAAALTSIYVLGYLFTFQKFILLAPLWIAAIWFSSRFEFFRRPVGLVLIYTFPFFVSFFWIILELPGNEQALGLLPARLYAVPGQIFAHYADFFSTNPHTGFSHISGISSFVEYPYDQPIPLMIRDSYPGGNQNANFWAQDAIAGAGIWAIPFVSLLFGILLFIVNSASSGLDPRFSYTAVSLTAQRFSDGTLATGLLSGGLALTILLLTLAPRDHFGVDTRRKRKWQLL
jgi:hypothetical protein